MEIKAIREKALRAISPIAPAETEYFGGRRTIAGFKLPEYYLVYFLLVDLLGFDNLGRHEKVAWSVPIDFEGQLMHIEHRKLGLGVFSSEDSSDYETVASEVVELIRKGVKVAQPYYDGRAEKAVTSSQINIRNKSNFLYDRFEYFCEAYKAKCNELEGRGGDTSRLTWEDGLPSGLRFVPYQIKRETEWLAQSNIESFFSWTEHIFIHLAILQGKCVTGDGVKNLVGAEWKKKFKLAFDISLPDTKRFYDGLLVVRNQARNFVAHGAFGKDGEAFLFHSAVGAVPVKLPHQEGKHSYRFRNQLDSTESVSDNEAIMLIEEFIAFIRSGELAPAWIHLDNYLDTVLTFAQDDTYRVAMASEDAMNDFVEYMSYMDDLHTNMDF